MTQCSTPQLDLCSRKAGSITTLFWWSLKLSSALRSHGGHLGPICIEAQKRPQPTIHSNCSPRHDEPRPGRADLTARRASSQGCGAGCQDTEGSAMLGPPTPRQAVPEWGPARHLGRGGSPAPSLPVFSLLSLSAENLLGLTAAERNCVSPAVTRSPHLALGDKMEMFGGGGPAGSLWLCQQRTSWDCQGLPPPTHTQHSTSISRSTAQRGPTQVGARLGFPPSKSLLVPWHVPGSWQGLLPGHLT